MATVVAVLIAWSAVVMIVDTSHVVGVALTLEEPLTVFILV